MGYTLKIPAILYLKDQALKDYYDNVMEQLGWDRNCIVVNEHIEVFENDTGINIIVLTQKSEGASK